MKKITKILLLSFSFLLVSSMSGCTSSRNNQLPVPTASTPEPAQPEPTQQETSKSLYIYNSKWENATQLSKAAASYSTATGVKVRDFSIGAGQNHMETLRAEMNTKNPPTIFSIQGLKELREWTNAGYVLDLNTVENPEFKKMVNDFHNGFRLTDDGIASYGIPYNVEGYGYIVDKQMLSDLFGADQADNLITDIKTSTYEEWEALIHILGDYIESPSSTNILINKNTYSLQAEKTGLAKELTGVFAVMGAEKWTYSDHFLNVALNAVFQNAAEANSAADAAIDSLSELFIRYAKALDLKTSYLAGLSGKAVRGQEFISPAYSYDATLKIFAKSKAIFFKQGNWVYGGIANVNQELADRLTFLPIKMPITQDLITVEGLTVEKLNSSIPVFVPNYYAINAKAGKEEQQLAIDFLIWLNTSIEGQKFVKDDFAFIPCNADPATTVLANSLGNSILHYMKEEHTLEAPYNGTPYFWSSETLGLELMEKYMTKEKWSEEDYRNIAKYAIDTWKAMKE